MYKNLSKHGRFGDTEMVKTSSGSLWHVNKLEKKLIEKHGKLGEKLLDNISPSTINPKTGKEEKWLAAAAMFGLGLIQQYGTTRDARAQGREQMGFLDDSLSSLNQAGNTLQESLAPSLAVVSEKAKRTYGSASETFQENIGKIKQSKDLMTKKMGFARGPDDNDEDIKLYRQKAKKSLEDVDIKLTETLSGVLSQFEKQKFDLDTQRLQLEHQRKMAERQSNQKYFGII
tara:strand:+ start:2801 stop:3490 length:690 start_codon:yes stop_codon:yes gene_type:complete